LLAEHAAQIAQALPAGMALVDLGAANCRKAAGLLPVLRPAQYVAVDISAAFLAEALQALQVRHPALPMLGLGLVFPERWTLMPRL
jgi:uncharacterized SAM-dependent methyltransferase